MELLAKFEHVLEAGTSSSADDATVTTATKAANGSVSLYDAAVVPCVPLCVEYGYDLTVLAYGQSGSGKTWTLTEPRRGLVALFARDLFSHLRDGQKSDWDEDEPQRRWDERYRYEVSVSNVDVDNDDVHDLLGNHKICPPSMENGVDEKRSQQSFQQRPGLIGRDFSDLAQFECTSPEEVLTGLRHGEAVRRLRQVYAGLT